MSVHLQQIGRSVEIAHCLHSARLVEVLADIELFHFAARAQERNEVSTGGATPRPEMLWIEAVLICVRPQPAHGAFAVFNLGGKNGFATESIADAGHGITEL